MKYEIDVSEAASESAGSFETRIHTQSFRKLNLVPLALCILFLLAPYRAVYLQSLEDLDVAGVIIDVKKRFHLSAGDIKSIRPLVNRENHSVLAIYARYSGGVEPEYSNRVWLELIASHCEFRSRAHGNLTKRQLAALRAARLGMETRVVDYLLEDYVDFLGLFLELDRWEFNDVQKLFESDKSKKLRLFNAGGSGDFGSIQKEVEKISESTERQLRTILTEAQWRDYRSLTESPIPTA